MPQFRLTLAAGAARIAFALAAAAACFCAPASAEPPAFASGPGPYGAPGYAPGAAPGPGPYARPDLSRSRYGQRYARIKTPGQQPQPLGRIDARAAKGAVLGSIAPGAQPALGPGATPAPMGSAGSMGAMASMGSMGSGGANPGSDGARGAAAPGLAGASGANRLSSRAPARASDKGPRFAPASAPASAPAPAAPAPAPAAPYPPIPPMYGPDGLPTLSSLARPAGPAGGDGAPVIKLMPQGAPAGAPGRGAPLGGPASALRAPRGGYTTHPLLSGKFNIDSFQVSTFDCNGQDLKIEYRTNSGRLFSAVVVLPSEDFGPLIYDPFQSDDSKTVYKYKGSIWVTDPASPETIAFVNGRMLSLSNGLRLNSCRNTTDPAHLSDDGSQYASEDKAAPSKPGKSKARGSKRKSSKKKA